MEPPFALSEASSVLACVTTHKHNTVWEVITPSTVSITLHRPTVLSTAPLQHPAQLLQALAVVIRTVPRMLIAASREHWSVNAIGISRTTLMVLV
jgi:hypothetical protein